MNDMYAKDISKKIRSSLLAKQKEGKWVGGRTPFGYDQDPNDKNHLVINPEQANVVKRIFNMSLDGLTYYKIAKKLTNERVKTPAEYYSFEWKSHYNLHYGIWHAKTIEDILTNRIYIGDLVQNKRSKVNYKIKKIVKNHPDKYVIKENTHEAIIDKEIFYDVQRRLPKNVGRNEKKEKNLLDGLLYCGDCGHRLSVTARRKNNNHCYTICNYYRTYIRQKVCTTHSNNYDELEKVIIDNLRKECMKYIDSKKIKNNINYSDSKSSNIIKIKNKIKLLTDELNNMTCHIDDIYMDKIKGIINGEQFIRIKEKLEKEIENKKDEIADLSISLSNENNNIINKTKIDKYVDEFIFMLHPSRELIIELIDRIEIFEDKRINIKVCFSL